MARKSNARAGVHPAPSLAEAGRIKVNVALSAPEDAGAIGVRSAPGGGPAVESGDQGDLHLAADLLETALQDFSGLGAQVIPLVGHDGEGQLLLPLFTHTVAVRIGQRRRIADITDAITVTIIKTANKNLIKYRIVPPRIIILRGRR